MSKGLQSVSLTLGSKRSQETETRAAGQDEWPTDAVIGLADGLEIPGLLTSGFS